MGDSVEREARIRSILKIGADPNVIARRNLVGMCTKFEWSDWGFKLWVGSRGYNGNPPPFYAKGPDGRLWQYDDCMHFWKEVDCAV